MNVTTRTLLDAVPIPVEEHGPVRVMVVVSNGEWRTAFGLDGCRKPQPFGEPYVRALDATRAALYLNERGGV